MNYPPERTSESDPDSRLKISTLRLELNQAREGQDHSKVVAICREMAGLFSALGNTSEARRFDLMARVAGGGISSSRADCETLAQTPKPQNENVSLITTGSSSLSVRIPDFPLSSIIQFVGERDGIIGIFPDSKTPFEVGSVFLIEGEMRACSIETKGNFVPASSKDSFLKILQQDIDATGGLVTFRVLSKEAVIKGVEKVQNNRGEDPDFTPTTLTNYLFECFTLIDEQGRVEEEL